MILGSLLITSSEQVNLCKHCRFSRQCRTNTDLFKAFRSEIVWKDKGEYLFEFEQPFDAFYILCDGAAKAVRAESAEYPNRVVDFYYPGDVIGLCGFSEGVYQENVQMLASSRAFRVNREDFEDAMSVTPELATEFIRILSHSLVRRQQSKVTNNKLEAETRLLQFLEEQHQRLYDPYALEAFTLNMTRVDIANYLGVAIETLSRLMKKLANKGLIEVNHRNIVMLGQDM